MKKSVKGALYLSLAASIWGGMYVVSKYVLHFIPPLTLVWLRYVIAFIVLFATLRLGNIQSSLTKKDWLLISWIGFIGYFVSIGLQFGGTKLSDAHTASLITAAPPAFIVIFARWILKEVLTIRKLLAMGLATIGVIIVIGFHHTVSHSLLGNIMLVGAAVTWALLSVYVKVASERVPVLVITTYAILIAMILTTPFMIWEMQTTTVVWNDGYVMIGVLYLGIVSTAGAFFLWNKGMGLIDASVGSLFFFFQPLVGTLLGWLLLGETVQGTFFIGAFFIITGVSIAVMNRKH